MLVVARLLLERAVTEHGGAFIDSDQVAALDLVKELGLELEDFNGGELVGLPGDLLVRRRVLHLRGGKPDWEAVRLRGLPRAIRESNSDAGLARLDSLSAVEWLEQTPIGSTSRFGRLMLANTVSENGGDPGEQSALDLIGLTGVNPRSSLDPLPGYDEKWHVVGGNDQLVHGMAGAAARRHDPAWVTGSWRCARTVTVRYTLTFEAGGTTGTSSQTTSCSRCRSRCCATST